MTGSNTTNALTVHTVSVTALKANDRVPMKGDPQQIAYTVLSNALVDGTGEVRVQVQWIDGGIEWRYFDNDVMIDVLR